MIQMKKLIFGFIALITLSSFSVPSCKKHSITATVNVTIFDAGSVITFTGEQGQGVFVFDENTDTHNMPNNGTYTIEVSFPGGCGGLRVVKKLPNGDNQNILLVMPSGGTDIITGETLVSQYYASVNCE
jgi:hypothetical protein